MSVKVVCDPIANSSQPPGFLCDVDDKKKNVTVYCSSLTGGRDGKFECKVSPVDQNYRAAPFTPYQSGR